MNRTAIALAIFALAGSAQAGEAMDSLLLRDELAKACSLEINAKTRTWLTAMTSGASTKDRDFAESLARQRLRPEVTGEDRIAACVAVRDDLNADGWL